MEGCRRRELRALEHRIELAWRVENFSRAGKKFRNLDHYLRQLRPADLQSAEEVIAIFETFATRGLATINVREKD